MRMTTYELDPDVVRWGLHLLDLCSLTNVGAPETITHYDEDLSRIEHVRQGYCETEHVNVQNDGVIAHALQEELSRLADAETFRSSHDGEEHQQVSILAQDWLGTSNRHGHETSHEEECERGKYSPCSSAGEISVDGEDLSCSPEIADESTLDGEVGKRLNQMVPVPILPQLNLPSVEEDFALILCLLGSDHEDLNWIGIHTFIPVLVLQHVPKINGEIPSAEEETSDHQRLMDRLQLYELVELKVLGDGNCQFRSLSDQIYRSTEYHTFVREQLVDQLKSHPELYEGYVPMAFDVYLKKIGTTGEWGDHVTLQAAADAYGVKIFVITSFKDTCYIEILPHFQKSNRIIFLSFWAEVHYNSIYPQGDFPLETEKKKKWWMLGS